MGSIYSQREFTVTIENDKKLIRVGKIQEILDGIY